MKLKLANGQLYLEHDQKRIPISDDDFRCMLDRPTSDEIQGYMTHTVLPWLKAEKKDAAVRTLGLWINDPTIDWKDALRLIK